MKVSMTALGCAKNQVDSERMLFMLREMGHEITDAQHAEAVIVNTCGFIDPAKEESIDAIFSAVKLKEKGVKYVLVTGCLAQRYGKDLLQDIPEIDGIIGVEQYKNFPRLFTETVEGRKPFATARTGEAFECGRVLLTPGYTAYVRIAEGCDNRCTYCAIPLIRGGYRSIPMDSVLSEMRSLAAGGAREQILIAQDTSRYGRDRGIARGLPELLQKAGEIDGIDWLRVLYLYPDDVDKELIDAMASVKKMCRYVDIPLQHSVPSLLRAMNRRGDIARIEDTLSYAREKGFCLRTTMIVGFPGETDEDFDALCAFISRVQFDRLGAFAYSPEENTAAAAMPHQVPDDVKQRRLDTLMTLQAGISLKRNEGRVGTREQVLVCRKTGDRLFCRSAWEAPDADGWIIARGSAQPGEMITVKITRADTYDLYGETEDPS